MSVWNKDKVNRVLRLQNLLEKGFNLFKKYDNAIIFNKNNDYIVVNNNYKEMWFYTLK